MATRKKSRPPMRFRVAEHGVLHPNDWVTSEEMQKYKIGDIVSADPYKSRSHEQLGLYWGAIKIIIDATGIDMTSHALHQSTKEACGYVVQRVRLDGTLALEPD